MIRRISTKFLLAVLAAVVIPFLGFALFVDTQMAGRLSRDVVLYSLKGLAAELASRIDSDVEEFNANVALAALDPGCHAAIQEFERDLDGELDNESPEDRGLMRDIQSDEFDNWVISKRDYDLFLLVDVQGRLVACNTKDPSGHSLPDEVRDALDQRNYSDQVWFEAAKAGQRHRLGPHVSDLLPPRNAEPGKHPENYHIGFSAPVVSAATADEPEQFVGALYALVNWKRIQEEVESPVIKTYFQGLVGPEDFPSAYGWVWASDADTILAHDKHQLYGESVSNSPDIHLPQLTAAALAGNWGLYPEYEFNGKLKNAAFKHTRPKSEGGFDWIVGVGIDNDDIFKGVHELQGQLFRATAMVALLAVLCTMIVARRTTGPILVLREHVQRVAAGDLEARVAIKSRDELGELGAALNEMTAEIAHSREKLVKAEKEAAWREMARQVAHDIKNPLTPIQLSVELCKRAHDEKSPDFEHIFERTVEIVSRQVAHLREIASDFHALTGARPSSLAIVDVGALLDEVLSLEAAWAKQLGVSVVHTGDGGSVRADAALLRRVLLNLVSNGLEAMPQGGELACDIRREGDKLRIEISDNGVGLPDEIRARLFEPYFTTRTTGTGLGLAIAKRVVEDLGGGIELVPRAEGRGTSAIVVLPLASSA
jgi:signal transduction histidine kinase